jgi:ABC-type antimicrobial peptide transport system permease subunit
MITVTGVVSTVISYFFNLLYVNYIDTHFVEKSLMQTQKMMASMGGANDEVMEAMRVQLEAQMEFSGLNLGLALAGAVVMYVIVGLILSLIFRKSDPEAVY